MTNKIEELETRILEAEDCYYDPNKEEIMSNSEFDTLVAQLTLLAPNSHVLASIGGSGRLELDIEASAFSTIRPNKSIQPVFDYGKAQSWSVGKNITDYVSMLKMDGFNITAEWNNDGYYTESSLRGRNGAKGNNVTEHLRSLVPEFVEEFAGMGTTNVIFEGVLHKEHLDVLRERHPETKFSNLRNSVGTLVKESFDPNDMDCLTLFAFNYHNDMQFDYLTDRLQLLSKYFLVPSYVYVVDGTMYFCSYDGQVFAADLDPDDKHSITLFHSYQEQFIADFPYLTDGTVLCINSLDALDSMGGSVKYDNGKLACKYGYWANKVYRSTLMGIEWSEGRTGLTPVGIMRTVLTDSGKEVTRVNLENLANMIEFGISVGDDIFFQYSSEINPNVLPQTQVLDYLEQFSNTDEEHEIEMQNILQTCSFSTSKYMTNRETVSEMSYASSLLEGVQEDLLSMFND
jgi:NAD-dependent DNA ligase